MDIFKNHFYINLDRREDRNNNTIRQLKKIGIDNPNRFKAIENDMGIVGCGLSHIKVIQKAKELGWDHIVVFEDDIDIIEPRLLKIKVKNLMNKEWDVLMLGGNNFKPFTVIDKDCIKVNKCFTTTAYIIKSHYYDTWIDNLKEGVKKLMETGDRQYSLDLYNHSLQRKDNWLLLTPICIIQKKMYSDIENKRVDYQDLMLNYDK